MKVIDLEMVKNDKEKEVLEEEGMFEVSVEEWDKILLELGYFDGE